VALTKIIPLLTKEGYEYAIKFDVFYPDAVPASINIPVIDITIELLSEVNPVNNAKTLFYISEIINNYMAENDVVLYCYCDNAPIQKGKNKTDITNQEFRSLLFIKMFEKQNNEEYLNEQIIINDEANGDHYIHLFSKLHNKPYIDIIATELQNFNNNK